MIFSTHAPTLLNGRAKRGVVASMIDMSFLPVILARIEVGAL
jgi:hypothetical protein